MKNFSLKRFLSSVADYTVNGIKKRWKQGLAASLATLSAALGLATGLSVAANAATVEAQGESAPACIEASVISYEKVAEATETIEATEYASKYIASRGKASCIINATLPGLKLSTRTELLNTVTLTGDVKKDICALAKANVNNSSYKVKINEQYCEDFVIDICHACGVSQTVIPSDNGSVNHFYTALKKCGATEVTKPIYGDIIIYVNTSTGDKCHAGLYTLGSGVNTGKNDSIQGNLGGVIKECQLKNYYTTTNDGKKLTVGNGLKVIYMRPKYQNNKTVANAINAFNRNKTSAKNKNVFVINDATQIKFYSAPCASAPYTTVKAGIFTRGEKLTIDGYYNGFVRVIQSKNEGCNDKGRARTTVYGTYVKLTDLAAQAFNYNKSAVSAYTVYKINKAVNTRSAPCEEATVNRTIKAGSFVRVSYSGVNHVGGSHLWGIIDGTGEYIYLNTGNVEKVTLKAPTVKSFSVTSSLLFGKKLTVKINSVKNANVYKAEFINTKTGKVYSTGNKTSLTLECPSGAPKNNAYKVRVYAGVKLYNGAVYYAPCCNYSNTVTYK